MVPEATRSALVTGGTGYIGSIAADYLGRHLGILVWAPGSSELDVRDGDAVRRALESRRPDVVLHCAAKADTDWCEKHFDEALAVNVDGALNVVRAALEVGSRVAYLSSACLYPDNRRPYREEDDLAALCGYTRTKLLAEEALAPYRQQILTVRMRQPFSNHRHPRNLLQKLARYTEFIDEPNSMSHLEECLPILWAVCVRGDTGPLNLTNPGWTSPLRIAYLIEQHWQPEMEIGRISYSELLEKVDAVRVNSLVDCTRLESMGFALRPVEEAVADCLSDPCDLGTYDWARSSP